MSEPTVVTTQDAAKVHHRSVTIYRHYPDWYVGHTDQTANGQRSAYVIVGSLREAKEQMDAWFKEADYA